MPVLRRKGSVSLPYLGGVKDFMIRPLKSSNISWIGWPDTGEPLMVVEFSNGTRYAYPGVTRQRAVACAYADSSGEYLNKRIKPHFEVVKLR